MEPTELPAPTLQPGIAGRTRFFSPWGTSRPISSTSVMTSPRPGTRSRAGTALPILALAIPFSARVMAYLRYPYAQDYADFMPGAVFVLLLVMMLGYLFESPDQKFFLPRVWENSEYLYRFGQAGVLLAFVPVFFEGTFWLLELSRADKQQR